jgi:endoglucanase
VLAGGAAALVVVSLALGAAKVATPVRSAGSATSVGAGSQLALARAAARSFLDGYVDPDGRVVRRDQGGDSVSEGQAYGMLAAAAVGDGARFDLIWGWTKEHLQRPDALFAWHWSRGRLVDHQAASDADLDAARALMVASCSLRRPDLRADAGRIGRAVLAHETRARVLTAGPWATTGQTVFNPSYLDPSTLLGLGHLTGDHRYSAVAQRGRDLIRSLSRPLPPDWATVSGGDARPARHGRFSWDAPRTLVRLAADPNSAGRAIAARAWPRLRRGGAGPRSSVTLAGAAGAAQASGYHASAAWLLHQAAALQQAHPTYFGAAWTALGRLMLTTRRLDVRPC